jgi:hypothetical protein
MVLLRYICVSVLFAVGMPFAASAETAKTFPTDSEINLVLTQTDRAVQQYKPLIELQAAHSGQSVADAIARDRQVVTALELALKAFKGKPQGFNGPLGFSFFQWLDDASRNAALCAGGSSNEAMAKMLAGNVSEARSLIQLGQSCADASSLIYTVSENAGSLYQRYVEAEEQLVVQAADVAQKCTEVMKKNNIPSKK